MAKLPTGSSSSNPGDRPRAQVAYEGEDEFSTMSLDPERRRALNSRHQLLPPSPGQRPEVKVDDLRPVTEKGIVGLIRKIFAK